MQNAAQQGRGRGRGRGRGEAAALQAQHGLPQANDDEFLAVHTDLQFSDVAIQAITNNGIISTESLA
jgi:hypothetical protein